MMFRYITTKNTHPFSLLGTLLIQTTKLSKFTLMKSMRKDSASLKWRCSAWDSDELKTTHTLYFDHVLWERSRTLLKKTTGSV